MCSSKIVIFSNWTVSCLKRYSQYNLKHIYQKSNRDLQLQLQLIYTIVYLLDIPNEKHIRRSSYVINLKHCTSIYLTVKPIYFFLVKFMLISLYYIIALNWWYLLGIWIMIIALYAIYKKTLFSTLYILSLIKNFFLNILTLF